MSRRSTSVHYTRLDLEDIQLNGSSSSATLLSSSSNGSHHHEPSSTTPATPSYHPLPRSRRSLFIILSAILLALIVTLFHRQGSSTTRESSFIQSTFNKVDLKKWSKIHQDGAGLSRVFGSKTAPLDDKRITLIAMW